MEVIAKIVFAKNYFHPLNFLEKNLKGEKVGDFWRKLFSQYLFEKLGGAWNGVVIKFYV